MVSRRVRAAGGGRVCDGSKRAWPRGAKSGICSSFASAETILQAPYAAMAPMHAATPPPMAPPAITSTARLKKNGAIRPARAAAVRTAACCSRRRWLQAAAACRLQGRHADRSRRTERLERNHGHQRSSKAPAVATLVGLDELEGGGSEQAGTERCGGLPRAHMRRLSPTTRLQAQLHRHQLLTSRM